MEWEVPGEMRCWVKCGESLVLVMLGLLVSLPLLEVDAGGKGNQVSPRIWTWRADGDNSGLRSSRE